MAEFPRKQVIRNVLFGSGIVFGIDGDHRSDVLRNYQPLPMPLQVHRCVAEGLGFLTSVRGEDGSSANDDRIAVNMYDIMGSPLRRTSEPHRLRDKPALSSGLPEPKVATKTRIQDTSERCLIMHNFGLHPQLLHGEQSLLLRIVRLRGRRLVRDRDWSPLCERPEVDHPDAAL